MHTVAVVHDKATDVMLENQDPVISSGTLLKLRWSPESVLPVEPADSYTLDIILREYNNTSREWVFTDIARDIIQVMLKLQHLTLRCQIVTMILLH